MVSPRGDWVYTTVEDPTLHCFSTYTKNLEQDMQVSGLLCGGWVHAHAHIRMYMQKEENVLPLLFITM